MLKTILPFILLLPLAASAECGFANADSTMTIVVNSKTNKCFTSEAFREAFRANLIASVKAMEDEGAPASAQKRAIDHRSARAQKLWNLEERLHQATVPSGRYFGQQR